MRATVQLTATQASTGVDPEVGGADEVTRLRAQMERIQGRRLDAPVIPVHAALASLLPGGGLRPGAAYSVPRSTSLLLALLAQPSQSGSWCGVVGMPRLGAEAAERLGVDLSRLVLIPDPGARWLAVTATVAEVLPVVAVRPSGRTVDSEIARLAARLRDRGAVLLVQGRWPQVEATLEISGSAWSGVARGHGYLAGREVSLSSSSRRWPRARRARVMLPDAVGGVARVESFPALAAVPDAGRERPERDPLAVKAAV
ncbi:hypothetical protein JOD63_000679 [Microbacterium terrae]|uniref:hypothetical protein n=1 Tax=Microbacterium terrae TaxID=69369 RepID=UPI001B47C682|nr:hypothetical protein [Microbacterium terrae]MBP1076711.1 hypothetical protein [Microbacterium terrae]GLJ97539.1 hypothetical protein GCM10017594_07360 [Microbacterium terrae]